MKRAIWQQALGDLAEEFFDVFPSPLRPFPDDVSYPVTPAIEALVDDRFDSLVLPERHLLRLVELMDEDHTGLDERKMGDWVVLLEWDILHGFGGEAAFDLDGASFGGLRQLATVWGAHLAQAMGRTLRMCQMCEVYGDLLLTIFRQLPARELGEALRHSLTPSYLKAQASVQYATALFLQQPLRLREAEEVLQASDADLSREIAIAISGMSSLELGTYMKRAMTQAATLWRDLLSNHSFRPKFLEALPAAFESVAWYIGYCFRWHVQNNPARVKRVLEAIERRQEVHAAMEQLRWMHHWGGDQNKAVGLAWQSVARKFFGLSGQIPTVSGNEKQVWNEDQQLKLIGVADGLETYCRKNPAIVGLMDGVSGGLGTYLATAAKNKEKSYHRKLRSDGNRALTEAEHVADHRAPDEEELPDDEVLSRLKERYHPSGDPVLQELEAKEGFVAWHSSLTEKEKTAISLATGGLSQEAIAKEMGIGQQRVSQLLGRALGKWKGICE